jgi:hypothetical protein
MVGLACKAISGSTTYLPAFRTVALMMTVPAGIPDTSTNPTFVPFGTAVAEHADSRSVPLQP